MNELLTDPAAPATAATGPAGESHWTLLTLPASPGASLSIRAKAMLFRDPRSVALLQHIDRIARSEASVLIIGETGTGKELVARHVHTRSGRKGPFVAVNCGAFTESLIDAELFGHESGAYTGAGAARAGWFEAANGGTLFLDEIGDLPLPQQVKLLRVLQERQVVRLGSRRPIALDVRLVAATNVALERAVQAGRFRADLYYRLNVAPVALPPLRERPGDILPLAHHFAALYGRRLGLDEPRLDADAEAALLAYPWPGNIRELENVVHYGMVLSRDGELRRSDLRLVAPVHAVSPLATPGSAPSFAAAPEASAPAVAAPVQALDHALRNLLAARTPAAFHAVEGALVRAAFEQCGQNQVQAARLLGITRNTLRTLLKRYQLLRDGRTEAGAADAGDETDDADHTASDFALEGDDDLDEGDAPGAVALSPRVPGVPLAPTSPATRDDSRYGGRISAHAAPALR